MSALRLLVATDLHYSSAGADAPGHSRRQCGLGLELLRRAVEDARNRGGFDAIAILGDLVNDAFAPTAGADLLAIRDMLARVCPDVPLLVVPGNHDDRQAVLSTFSQTTGLREIAGCRFFTFADRYAEGDVCTRTEADRQAFAAACGAHPGATAAVVCRRAAAMSRDDAGPTRPLIVLQHNPMNPAIEDAYPYMLTNRDAVMADYRDAGVTLSISGHYHAGQPRSAADGVEYFTAPALCEDPFRYTLITFRRVAGILPARGMGVPPMRPAGVSPAIDFDIDIRQLKLPADARIVDCHAHTQYAYCGRGIDASAIVERSRQFGLSGLCLVEHAPQLYLDPEPFWKADHIRRPASWRDGRGRMDDFRRKIEPLRSDFVRVGLEVELDCEGHLTLQDADRSWPDLLVGAIHFLPRDPKDLSDADLNGMFMSICHGLLAGGIDVLAHPWRLFQRENRPTPTHLYGQLADALARAGTAAEINLHTYANDATFLRECIARGVKIGLGSDTHATYEAGAFSAHLAILRDAAGREDVTDLMWRP